MEVEINKICKTCKWWGKSAIELGYLPSQVPEGYRECMFYKLLMKILKKKDPNPFYGIDLYGKFSSGNTSNCIYFNGNENKISLSIDAYLKWREDPKRINMSKIIHSKMSQMPCYTRSREVIRKILAETDEDRKKTIEKKQELVYKTKKEMLIRKLEVNNIKA